MGFFEDCKIDLPKRFDNDSTIMPDGRPLHAWVNELEMLRDEEVKIKEERKSYKMMVRLMNFVGKDLITNHDFKTGDIIIRIRHNDMLNKDFEEDIFKNAELINP